MKIYDGILYGTPNIVQQYQKLKKLYVTYTINYLLLTINQLLTVKTAKTAKTNKKWNIYFWSHQYYNH